MNDLFLGLIALATLTMALIQVGAIVFAARMARRVEALVSRVERDVQPLLARANEIGAEASRGVTLAVAQVERVDRLTADVAQRVDQTLVQVQRSIVTPARQGAALLSGLRAGFAAIRHLRERRPRQGSEPLDDDHALFIG